ncbi:MAG: DUF3488 domain-containing protein [Candidatus Hydrogenedentota bacterium]|nr:MAG: DUF3488 domain-containing protein [Candidatus Hydrogenedentota bacterium]
MRTQVHLRICGYLLALFGLWSVTLTEYFSFAWPLAATAMVVVSWFYEGPRKFRDAYRRVWMGLGLCMLLFFPFDVALFGTLLLPAVHISMFVQAYFLFNPKNVAAYRRIFIVSLTQLLASTNLTTGITFAAILAAYCITAVYGVILMQLLREVQTSGDVIFAATAEQGHVRGLISSSLIWTTILLPLTLGFFYSAPRLRYAIIARGNAGEAIDRLRRARELTGFTRTVRLGTFGLIQEDQTLALRIEIPAGTKAITKPLRWRGGALNIYDGMAWSSSRDSFAYYSGRQWQTSNKNSGMVFPRQNNLFIMDGRFANYGRVEQLDADPRLLKQICYLEIPFSESIFGAGEIAAVQGPFTYGIGRDFNGSFIVRNRQALPELISYTVYSVVYEPDETILRQISYEKFKELIEHYGPYLATHYLQLPPSLNPRIRRLALDITKDAETPYEKVNSIKNFLETQFSYSLDLRRPVTDDPLYDFLFVSRTGHCEYFATAMTLMTRILGIPARLAKGFQKGEWNETGQFYEVRQRDAHAWVEVYFPDHGWLAFDPSPRAVADEYFERQRSFIARAISKRLLLLRIQWRKHIVGYNETRRLRLFGGMKELLVRDGPRAVADLLGRLAGAVRNLVVSHGLMTAIIASVLMMAFYARRKIPVFPPLSWRLGRSRHRSNGAAFYERMLNLLERGEIVKPAHVTALEFLEFPTLREHPMFPDVEALTSMYYRVRFRGELLAENEASTVNNILKRLKQSNGRIHNREPTKKT